MEVIQVNLRSGLEFVKEVEQLKGKCSAWSPPGGREPPNAEQLNARRDAGAIRVTFTVGNIEGMDAYEIKQCERDKGGWYGPGGSIVVTKMEDSAKVFQRDSFEMGSSPVLRKVSACTRV